MDLLAGCCMPCFSTPGRMARRRERNKSDVQALRHSIPRPTMSQVQRSYTRAVFVPKKNSAQLKSFKRNTQNKKHPCTSTGSPSHASAPRVGRASQGAEWLPLVGTQGVPESHGRRHLGARTLLVAPGIGTRNVRSTRT